MDSVITEKVYASNGFISNERVNVNKNLTQAKLSTEYIIKDIITNDEELKSFLFTLGCYAGEVVTVISSFSENFVINVKDARYSIDKQLAEAIII